MEGGEGEGRGRGGPAPGLPSLQPADPLALSTLSTAHRGRTRCGTSSHKVLGGVNEDAWAGGVPVPPPPSGAHT